jgi:hypothetical protein
MKCKKVSDKQLVEAAVAGAVSQEAGTDAVESVEAVMVRTEQELPPSGGKPKPKPPKKRKPGKKRKPAKKR